MFWYGREALKYREPIRSLREFGFSAEFSDGRTVTINSTDNWDGGNVFILDDQSVTVLGKHSNLGCKSVLNKQTGRCGLDSARL